MKIYATESGAPNVEFQIIVFNSLFLKGSGNKSTLFFAFYSWNVFEKEYIYVYVTCL